MTGFSASQALPVEYFTEIEETFIRCRGRNLFLSSKDWVLIDTWQKKGIPQHVAIAAIEDVFDKRKGQGAVTSLAFCAPAVEERFTQWAAGRAGSSDETFTAVVETAPCGTCGKEYCLTLHRAI